MASRSNKPKRRAILIAAPGKGHDYLQGVNIDLFNLHYFLRSDEAGKWYDHEIVVLKDPTMREVTRALQNQYTDYQMIYYSGHGFHIDRSLYLCLKDGDLLENDLYVQNIPRQIFIFDACRNHIQAPRINMPLNGIESGDILEHFLGSPTRDLMDDMIAESPHGFQVVYATQEGVSATDSNKGGWFTTNLLHLAWNLDPIQKEISYITLDGLVSCIDTLVIDPFRRTEQIPEVQNVYGELHIPFAFGI